MLRRLCLILVACLLFAGPVAARGRISEAGIGDAKTPGDLSTWQARPLRLGEEFGCLAQRSGLSVEAAAAANGLLNPTGLAAGQSVQLPQAQEARTRVAARANDTPLSLAIAHNLPLWDVLRLNPQPLYAGAGVLLLTALIMERLSPRKVEGEEHPVG